MYFYTYYSTLRIILETTRDILRCAILTNRRLKISWINLNEQRNIEQRHTSFKRRFIRNISFIEGMYASLFMPIMSRVNRARER